MTQNESQSPALILGAGNIGKAMAFGIANAGMPVVVYNRSLGRLGAFANSIDIIATTDLDRALDAKPWLILLCVETAGVAELLSNQRIARSGAIIGSCAAVPTLADMRAAMGSRGKNAKLVRVLPNIAAGIGKSVNLIAADCLDQKEIDSIHSALACTGVCIDMPEQLFGAAMSLSSCGIAFALRYIRAQVEGAVALGIDPQTATTIAASTVCGAASLLSDGTHPEALIDRVTTPGGLTIRGLNAMEAAGFTPAVIAGISTAAKH